MRRNLSQLLQSLKNAQDFKEKARAHYELGLFHDNNSREAEAIPYYRKAIRYGLDRKREAMARAWLASSLYKTGNYRQASRECARSTRMTREPGLQRFLKRLQARIQIRLANQK